MTFDDLEHMARRLGSYVTESTVPADTSAELAIVINRQDFERILSEAQRFSTFRESGLPVTALRVFGFQVLPRS